MTRSRNLGRVALLLLSLLVAAPAAAQTEPVAAEAVADSPNAEAEAPLEGDGAGDDAPAQAVDVSVSVRRTAARDGSEPIAQANVRLHVIQPPHDVLRTIVGTTDDQGIATFTVEATVGNEVVAEVQDQRRYFSDPVDISVAGQQTISVEVLGTTSDPSVVRAESIHTIIEPWEGYVTVTQAFNLTVTEPVVYAAEIGEDGRPNLATLLMIPLPDSAEGINIIRPENSARASGTNLSTTMEVRQREPGERRGADIVVQYSIKTHDRSDVAWDQAISMDVDTYTVVVPTESSMRRHPVLDVEILTHDCSDASLVCLRPNADSRDALPLRADLDIEMVQGSASRGQTLRIETTGWPHRTRWERPLAAGLSGFALLFAVIAFVRDQRRRPDDPRELRVDALRAQRDSLMETAAELERRLDDGLILAHDYEVALERIRQQLGVVYRRLRELDEGEGTSAQA